MEDVHPSSSYEHKAAEAVILRHVAGELGVDDLGPARLELDGVAVELDGWSLSGPAAVEVYARASLPKGGAVKKPMDDAMRLLLVKGHHPEVKLLLAFAIDEVADAFRIGAGWHAAALRAAGIDVVSAGLQGDLLEGGPPGNYSGSTRTPLAGVPGSTVGYRSPDCAERRVPSVWRSPAVVCWRPPLLDSLLAATKRQLR